MTLILYSEFTRWKRYIYKKTHYFQVQWSLKWDIRHWCYRKLNRKYTDQSKWLQTEFKHQILSSTPKTNTSKKQKAENYIYSVLSRWKHLNVQQHAAVNSHVLTFYSSWGQDHSCSLACVALLIHLERLVGFSVWVSDRKNASIQHLNVSFTPQLNQNKSGTTMQREWRERKHEKTTSRWSVFKTSSSSALPSVPQGWNAETRPACLKFIMVFKKCIVSPQLWCVIIKKYIRALLIKMSINLD